MLATISSSAYGAVSQPLPPTWLVLRLLRSGLFMACLRTPPVPVCQCVQASQLAPCFGRRSPHTTRQRRCACFAWLTRYDPDFGTPLFSLDGGASQCVWEVGTAKRSMPTLAVEYIGPGVLGPDDTAVFKVTVANALDYYGAGPAGGKLRPGWQERDHGYDPPDFDLAYEATSLVGGLGVSGEFGTYDEFGKGKFDLLVTVARGLDTTSEATDFGYTYPPPELTWKQSCGGDSIGEDAAAALLSMPNPEQVVKFTKPCPAIDWSGDLLSKQQFSVLAGDVQAVDASVVVREDKPGNREFTRVALEWRVVHGPGAHSTWHGLDTNEAVPLAPGGGRLFTGSWNVRTMEDSAYEIRVVAECTELPSSRPYDSSTTGTVRGVVDRAGPELLTFTTSSFSDVFAEGDHFILTFTETIVCHGYLADANRGNGLTTAALELLVSFGGKKSFKSGPLPGNLDYACEGNELKVSAPAFTAATARDVAGEEISVKIFGGLYDRHGNGVVPVDGKVLASGRAGEERQLIAREVAAGKKQIGQKLSAVNGSLGALVGAKFDGVSAKIGSANNKTQDLVLNLEAELKSDVGDLKSDVKNQMDALNQSNAEIKQSNTEMKGAIASLAAMMASLLRASGVEAAMQFPACAGPALYSFGRYIKGRVPRGAATLTAAATAATCADQCLKVPTCTAFSFGAGDGCRLANRDLGTDYDFGVRSQLHVRLTECTK